MVSPRGQVSNYIDLIQEAQEKASDPEGQVIATLALAAAVQELARSIDQIGSDEFPLYVMLQNHEGEPTSIKLHLSHITAEFIKEQVDALCISMPEVDR